ncbi:copper transporter 6 isoform X1 [Lactuca sativa]|uniref:copper transporter 6 isoform X1 n=1 Tax=Lactuca sativa TaxID=4236 RepID=UPI000CBF06A8|nr:copper transporter 6 isoform X1 [Lactuca sativa]
MDEGHMNGMTDMSPPPIAATGASPKMAGDMMHHHPMMHMAFFWGKNGDILFPGWPGTNSGMYAFVLIFVFFLAFLVEFLSHSNFARKGSGPLAVGLVQTLVHTLRAGLAYMVMLAVMSFNGGVFLMAVAGHSLGFLVFGTWIFKKPQPPLTGDKNSDISPMICA